MSAVLGVDGCATGWIGVVLRARGMRVVWAPGFAALVEQAGDVDCIGVDIPIGLPDSGRRQADVLARHALGRRRSTVFDTAVRAAYEAATHAEADAVHRASTGTGLSVQAYRLGPKVLDVDAFARRGTHVVLEVHPELSFARMAGGPVLAGKKTWAGQQRRRALLAEQGLDVTELQDSTDAGLRTAPDDVLDAVAVAWSAHRWVQGVAVPLPAEPEVFSDGHRVAIWC